MPIVITVMSIIINKVDLYMVIIKIVIIYFSITDVIRTVFMLLNFIIISIVDIFIIDIIDIIVFIIIIIIIICFHLMVQKNTIHPNKIRIILLVLNFKITINYVFNY